MLITLSLLEEYCLVCDVMPDKILTIYPYLSSALRELFLQPDLSIGGANTESLPIGSDNGSGLQLISVRLQDMQANRPLLASSQIHQAQNSGMGLTVDYGQLAKIFIQRDQNPLFLMSLG